ncbi:MAG: hypothetical protein FLDDKLPJ_01733 [Phycisphaerae bacterium]|nr:hypothetical protein [Phycisphaerae bacterium]
MAVFKWDHLSTRHFGEVWSTFASLELRAVSGRFYTFTARVDTGAVVSLLRRSCAAILGLELTSGKRVDMSGVGSGSIFAYLHEIPLRFDGGVVFPTSFAIAEVEDVPNLLGRHGVMDRYQMTFDPVRRETAIKLPETERGGSD